MGSLEAACISGFLCRLCSEIHRMVIHIYGDQGQRHELAQKINDYLPVTITPTDPLPKTICKACMTRVEQHHELMLKMAKHREFFASQAAGARVIRPENLLAQRRSESNASNTTVTNRNGAENTTNSLNNSERTVVCNNNNNNNNNRNSNINRTRNRTITVNSVSIIDNNLTSSLSSDSNTDDNSNDNENNNSEDIINNSSSNTSATGCMENSNSNTDSNIISSNYGNSIISNAESDNASI